MECFKRGENMFWVYMKYNLKIMLKKKLFWIVLYGMLFMAVGMPLYNVWRYRGCFDYELPSADILYLGNYNGLAWGYISVLVPFLIVLPYGFSYISEVRTGTKNYVQVRGTRKMYYYTQLFVCFLSVFFVFFFPFLINICLNGAFFPVNGNDHITLTHVGTSNWSANITGSNFLKNVFHHGMILKQIVINYPQLYNVIFAGIASVSLGIMGMFIYAISLILKKNYVYLMITSFMIFQLFIVCNHFSYDEIFSSVYIDLKLTDYLANRMIASGKDYIVFGILMLAGVLVSVLIIRRRIVRDELC